MKQMDAQMLVQNRQIQIAFLKEAEVFVIFVETK